MGDVPGPELNSIKVLRTQLLNYTREKDWRTVMITSVQPGEGKTITSINLAFAMSRDYQQTVSLVECDMRNPTIGNYLGIDEEVGLSDYFLHNRPLHELILRPEGESLTLILGGTTIPDPVEIMGSQHMKNLVDEMKDRYPDRYIFFDFPPLLSVADGLAFLPHVDCVIFVVEAGRTSVKDIKKAQKFIPEEKLLGFVLNKDNTPLDRYGYY